MENEMIKMDTVEKEEIDMTIPPVVDIIPEEISSEPFLEPSKTFVGLVIGGAAALAAVCAGIAWKKHKKNKAEKMAQNEFEDEDPKNAEKEEISEEQQKDDQEVEKEKTE